MDWCVIFSDMESVVEGELIARQQADREKAAADEKKLWQPGGGRA